MHNSNPIWGYWLKMFDCQSESLIPETPAARAVSVLPLPFESAVYLCVRIEGRRLPDNDNVSLQNDARVLLLLK